jgi:hypothetical protein
MAPILAPLLGVLFTGAYLPQKSDLEPPIERQYKPFQKHVSSYQVKRCLGCFIWAAPTALRGRPYLIMEELSFSMLTRGADSNPARVLSREAWHGWKYLFSFILRLTGVRWVSKHMFYQSKLYQPWTERESNYRSTSLTDSKWPLFP